MPDLLVKSKSASEAGSLVKVTPESAGWGYVGFEVFLLKERTTTERHTGEEEVCLVLLSGLCNVSIEGKEWRDIGGRESVFDGAPCALYLP
ncbi:MAG: 5-deoxy-glucuronate isomerase, partial [Actinomycetota bacterium]|nr:5-deoxy-glucuronate isomerase [Actinomycetota bacterium]